MNEPPPIETASKRLALALDALAAAVDRRQAADRGEQALASQLQALATDRSRMAADLDTSAARVRSLEEVNREIARRLEAAIGAIRAILADVQL